MISKENKKQEILKSLKNIEIVIFKEIDLDAPIDDFNSYYAIQNVAQFLYTHDLTSNLYNKYILPENETKNEVKDNVLKLVKLKEKTNDQS